MKKFFSFDTFPIKNNIKLALAVFFFLVLLIVPIRMGTGANSSIPVIGTAETVTQEYCQNLFIKAGAAYAAVKACDKALTMASSLELSVGVASVQPGKALEVIDQLLNSVESILLLIMGVSLVGSLTSGLISFICLKCLLLCGLGLFIVNEITRYRFTWMGSVSSFLVRVSLVLWLIFPAMVCINNYVEHNYTDKLYNTTLQEAESFIANDLTIDKVMPEELANNQAKETPHRGIKEKLKDLKENIEGTISRVKGTMSGLLNSAEKATKRYLELTAIFVLTTFVIPLIMILLLFGLFKSMSEDKKIQSYIASLEQKVKESGKIC